MRKAFLVMTTVVQVLGWCWAGTAQAAIGADILRTPVFPKAIALGGAYVSSAEDIYSVLYNPAGLSQINKTQLCFVHNMGLIDSREYFAFGKPMKVGGMLGGSLLFRNMPTIDNSGAMTDDGTAADEPVNSRDMVINFTYGYALKTDDGNKDKDLGLGINFKWLRSVLGNLDSTAIAADLGVWWRPNELQDLQMGLVVQNLGTAMKFELEEDKLPLNVAAGAGYKLYQDSISAWKVMLDINYPMDTTLMMVNAGTEYWFSQLIAIRLGYRYQTDSIASGIQGGIGFNYPLGNTQLQLDYAYKPMQLTKSGSEAEHYISIMVGF